NLFFLLYWSLYPSIFGQAIPSTFGLFNSAKTVLQMARIVDLDLLVAENIQFKIGGNVFEIPGNPSTELVLKFMAFEERKTKKGNKDAVEMLAEMVAYILDMDKNHTVDVAFVKKNFSPSQMQKIVQVFTEVVAGIDQNPN
ncbi:hypothetical protein, partial [Ammoniphilus resinae]